MSADVLTYESFEPDTLLGRRELLLDEDMFRRWFALFPEDDQGPLMPAGMVAAVAMRAYAEILTPRPPGNVHGAQRFEIRRLPRLGDRLVTEFRCVEKNVRRGRNWVTLATTTSSAGGDPLFVGQMAVLWAV